MVLHVIRSFCQNNEVTDMNKRGQSSSYAYAKKIIDNTKYFFNIKNRLRH
jgi:hypothetical protein